MHTTSEIDRTVNFGEMARLPETTDTPESISVKLMTFKVSMSSVLHRSRLF